ncbi:MAG: DUF1553 domain-containing protein, partial [Planctomycetota bacterium]
AAGLVYVVFDGYTAVTRNDAAGNQLAFAFRVTPELLEADPENRLLARGVRHRLPSWMIRDQALALSGLFVEKVGGPPVRPYQPKGIWADASFGKIRYSQDHGEKLYRRSLYTFWRRIVKPTMFFDTATRQTCTVRAQRTNTPLHALITLNETTFVESARNFAERLLREASEDGTKLNDETRLRLAFRLATSRRATDGEFEILKRRFHLLVEEFGKAPEEAKKLLSVGESKRGESVDVAKHAGLTAICSLILNLDEVLSKE